METPTLESRPIIAFAGTVRLAAGSLLDVTLAAQALSQRDPATGVLAFDALTSDEVELDLRGSPDDVRARIDGTPTPKATAGRPKIGVTSKEVTLLPRHWEWLAAQRGGASATLRRLVEDARRQNATADERRAAQDAVYKFATAMAGNSPGYEDAMRTLYAGDATAFADAIAAWPNDVRAHATHLAAKALGPAAG